MVGLLYRVSGDALSLYRFTKAAPRVIELSHGRDRRERDDGLLAQRAGLSLRDTKVLVFGNPAAGTAVMQENALIALELPLKVLVWQNDENDVFVTYLAGAWLADRYGIVEADRAKVLAAVDRIVTGVTSAGSGAA